MEIKSYEEYMKEQKKNKKWDFDLFKIVCKKCGSDKVEFNSDMENSNGYYGESYIGGGIIVKCNKCGNAVKIDHYDIVD